MELGGDQGRKWFARFAWALLAYNVPVILWGAYVRISFSGDGCGAHWPFCSGQVLPPHMATSMAIEFAHRMTTVLDSIGTIALCAWSFLAFPRRHAVRFYAALSLIFLLVEALLGAGLVLLRYVAHDQSAGRAVYLSAHLTNTMLLLGALTITARLAGSGRLIAGFTHLSPKLWGALLVTVFVSITGAVTALGDTLFPASSLTAGLQQDWASTSSLLLRLRVVHPAIAIAGAAYLIWVAIAFMRQDDEPEARSAGARVLSVTLFQVAVGAINVTLLAPVWIQLFHLLMADVLWIVVVLMAMEATGQGRISGDSEAGRAPELVAGRAASV